MVASGRGCQHGGVDLQDLERRAARFDTAAGMRQLRIAVSVLLFLGMSTCLAKGANGPVDPRLVQAATLPPFGQIAFRIIPAAPPPSPTTVAGQAPAPTVAPTEAALECALLADVALARERNLNGRSDLAEYRAMVIVHDGPVSTPFTPRAINFPTSIAFFDAKGGFVATADVEPCPAEGGCPPVAAPAPYRYLVITARGQLAGWGAGPGSRIELAGDCPPPNAAPAPAPPPA